MKSKVKSSSRSGKSKSSREQSEADLADMIAKLTPDNLQDFIPTGPAVGKEFR